MTGTRTAPQVLGALTVVVVLLLAGCRSDGSDGRSTAGGGAATGASELTGTITVSGATSLKAAFTRIGEDFSAAHPGVEVTFNFDASSALASQIVEGAPADVFASADEANLAKLTDEGLIAGEPEVFAANELVLVTKPGNPEGIETLSDLSGAGVISLCGEDVPCGTYAEQALDSAGVTIPESSVTRGQNAAATLTAVSEGDAVAGIVYVTDAESAGDAVEAVAIPADANVIATYPIGALEAAGNPDAAGAFTAYVLSDEAQAVLQEYGFLPPP